MMSKTSNKGGFTLPGEAGYEDLTLDLARRWGADAIRDSDGTVLSDKITGPAASTSTRPSAWYAATTNGPRPTLTSSSRTT